MTAADNVRWQALVIERHQHFVLNQQVPPPRFALQVFNGVQQFAVTGNKGRLGLVVAFHQGTADEQVATLLRVHLTVGNTAFGNNVQAVETDLFITHDLGTFLFPVGFEEVMLHHMPGQGLDPLRLNLRHHPRKHAAGFDNFRRHNPLRAGFRHF